MSLHSSIKAVAWDFDGVLNRNVIDGRFVWHLDLQQDLGISPDSVQTGIFTSSFIDVIAGKVDLLDHVQAWLEASAHSVTASDFLDYWFQKDDLKDPLTGDLLDRLTQTGLTQVIATNNETRRATYIETNAGFSQRVARVFSSGRIGAAKPDTAFFDHVSTELDLEPQNILLIDDSARNVDTARSLGWHGFHFTESTRNELAGYLGF